MGSQRAFWVCVGSGFIDVEPRQRRAPYRLSARLSADLRPPPTPILFLHLRHDRDHRLLQLISTGQRKGLEHMPHRPIPDAPASAFGSKKFACDERQLNAIKSLSHSFYAMVQDVEGRSRALRTGRLNDITVWGRARSIADKPANANFLADRSCFI